MIPKEQSLDHLHRRIDPNHSSDIQEVSLRLFPVHPSLSESILPVYSTFFLILWIGLGIFQHSLLSARWNSHFPARSQWTALATLSCPCLYSFLRHFGACTNDVGLSYPSGYTSCSWAFLVSYLFLLQCNWFLLLGLGQLQFHVSTSGMSKTE